MIRNHHLRLPRLGARCGLAWQGSLQLEVLMVASIAAILASVAIHQSRQMMAIQLVEGMARHVGLGLERGRAAAERLGIPCGLHLSQDGWQAPIDGHLPACHEVEPRFHEAPVRGDVVVAHNLPSVVRFSSNGLILDGGTILVSAPGTELVRCLVISLPLGIVRHGRLQDRGCHPEA